MAVDWTNPGNTRNYANVLGDLTGRDLSLAKRDYGTDTNVPTDSTRHNQTTKRVEKWNGSTWNALPYGWGALEYWGGTSGGSGSAYTLSVTGVSSLYAGLTIAFVPNHTNANNPTLNVNSLGAINVKYNQKNGGGILVSGSLAIVVYDGTYFHLVNEGGGWGSYTPTFGANGSMTYTGVSSNAKYRWLGNSVQFFIIAGGTTGGTASNELTFTLPINSTNTGTAFTGYFNVGGTVYGGRTNTTSATIGVISKYDNTNLPLSGSANIYIQGIYEC